MPDYDPRIKGDKKVNKQLFWWINWLFIKDFGLLVIHIIKNKSLKRNGMDSPIEKRRQKSKQITLFEIKKVRHINKQPHWGLIGFLPYILLAYISSIGQEQINYRTGTDSSLPTSKIGQFGRIIIFLNI